MSLSSKTIHCDCGHSVTTDRERTWCTQCGGRIFQDPQDKRKYRYFIASVWLILACVFGLVVYFFVEIVMKPMV